MDWILDNRVVLINVAYLIAAVCFIVGLKLLSSPATARRGNQIAALGMAIAVVATLFMPGLHNIWLILVGLAIGAVVAVYPARSVKMTAMPQMVAIFNGMGGATAALVSLVEFQHKADIGRGEIVSIVLGVIIGSISFSGSMIAFGKLQELISGRAISYPNQQPDQRHHRRRRVALAVVIIALGQASVSYVLVVALFAGALVLGVLTVLPIGGADMPVVIAVLNSMTGCRGGADRFRAQQPGPDHRRHPGRRVRRLPHPVHGAGHEPLGQQRPLRRLGRGRGRPAARGAAAELPMREATPDDAAVPLAYADKVIIVPGYGLAVAQAQHAVRELAETLQERGVHVQYAIHPVAGRMPGHMNVLLAEANVPYDDLYEMEQINDDFANTDVAIVVGANDVTNPAARDDPSSPIYGMPILNVDQAKTVYVLKRGRGAGFAGIENMLFHDPKTAMLFGDAKDSLSKLNAAVREA